MGAELRKNILDKLNAKLIKTGGETSDEAISLVDAYYNSLSQDISLAIGAVDDISAPFVIAVLEAYAQSVRRLYPDSSTVAEWLKELPSIEVMKNQN